MYESLQELIKLQYYGKRDPKLLEIVINNSYEKGFISGEEFDQLDVAAYIPKGDAYDS